MRKMSGLAGNSIAHFTSHKVSKVKSVLWLGVKGMGNGDSQTEKVDSWQLSVVNRDRDHQSGRTRKPWIIIVA